MKRKNNKGIERSCNLQKVQGKTEKEWLIQRRYISVFLQTHTHTLGMCMSTGRRVKRNGMCAKTGTQIFRIPEPII